MNPILEYNGLIESGKIVVGQKVKKAYKQLAQQVTTPGEYYYDEAKADHIIQFFHAFLRHSKGKWGGQRISLELWQRALFSAVYGFVNIDGVRKYSRCILIVGKKNGKSFMSSGVGLYGLTADNEPGAEVYSVATKRDQAKIIWDEARRMRNKSPALRKRIRATVQGMHYDNTDGIFKPLASDVNTMDGLNVYYALMDEFQQWVHGRALYDIIADGVSAREQPLIFMTSTAGTVREDIYDEIYSECEQIINGYGDPNGYHDEHTLPIVYEVDSRDEWTNPAAWIKANPNLGVSKSFGYLKDKVDRAQKNAALVKNLVCKEFNIRETSGEAALTFDEANNESTFDVATLKPRYGIGGFDLSRTTDLTAAVMLFRIKDDPTLYIKSMFWIPYDTVEAHVKSDHVPYDMWIDRGYVRTCPGNRIDYKMVHDWFIEIQDQDDIYIASIGYDSYSAAYLVEEMKQTFGVDALEQVIQGAKTLSGPLDALLAEIKAHRVNYNNNPVMKWCLTNLAIQTDRNGNVLPVKALGASKRIDGFAAMLDAFVQYERKLDEYMSMI